MPLHRVGASAALFTGSREPRSGLWIGKGQPRSTEEEVRCALCGRVIPAQAKSSLHHLVPKLKGGARRGTVRLHRICHSAIHVRYTEAEIARTLTSPELLRSAPELACFVAWVKTKPDDFHAPTRRAGSRTAKRR